MATEIERKYLVSSPDWQSANITSAKRLTQGYMTQSHPDVRSQPEARVRVVQQLADNNYPEHSEAFITFKSKGTLTRKEVEMPVSVDQAKDLLEMCDNRVLVKDRYCISEGGKVWEVDVYHGHLSGLVVAEVELTSENEKVDTPSWIGTELTEDTRFKNANLIGVRWDGQDLRPAGHSKKNIKP